MTNEETKICRIIDDYCLQEKAWAVIMSNMDVLLTAPCHDMEEAIGLVRQDNPGQVLILCLTVNSVMEEKSKLPRVPTAYITMSSTSPSIGKCAPRCNIFLPF